MKIFKSILTISILLIIIFVAFFYSNKVTLDEGELFTYKKIFFDDNNNNNISLMVRDYSYTVCFYLDASQSESIERLNGIKNIMSIYSDDVIDYTLIWENEIPFDALKEVGIDESKNISLKGKYKLTNTKPSSFIINDDNKVEVIAEPSYLNLTRKIYEFSNNKKGFINNTNKMIMENIYKNYVDKIDNNKDMLLIFTSTSCKRCIEIDKLISGNINIMKSKFNVIDVKPDFDEGKVYSDITIIDYHLTYFRTYACNYNLSALPLFVIIDSKLEVKDYFSDTEEFITYINNISLEE